MAIHRFTYKLAGMRKADDFVVYKQLDDGTLIAQGDRTIAAVNPQTGKGLLNWRGSNRKYFVHLSRVGGAQAFTFPPEFIALCLYGRAESGDLIGSHPETGPVYVN